MYGGAEIMTKCQGGQAEGLLSDTLMLNKLKNNKSILLTTGVAERSYDAVTLALSCPT